MHTLKLVKSLGRTGNSLLCVVNAIIFAMEHDIEVVDFTELQWWTTQLLPNGKNELINKLQIKISPNDLKMVHEMRGLEFQDYIHKIKPAIKWNKTINKFESLFCGFYLNIGTFEERRYVVQKYISPILNIPSLKTEDMINSNDLLIHLRSGDIFSHKGHNAYIQPPLSFYIEVISSRTWNKIIIITENEHNPCFSKLKEKYPNIISFLHNKQERLGGNGNGFKHDLSWLINCTHYVACQSSLCPLIIQLSKTIKHVYLPSYILKTTGQNIIRETRIWWTTELANKNTNFTNGLVEYHVLNYDNYIDIPKKIYEYQEKENINYLLEYNNTNT
jgi:hypothetical protein